jgi:hypothetical protein
LPYWSFMDAENATAVTAPIGRDRNVLFRLNRLSHISEVRPGTELDISDHFVLEETVPDSGSCCNRTRKRCAVRASKNKVHSASDHRGPSAEKGD